MFAVLRLSILGISPRETSVERRGFRVKSAYISNRLERIGRAFLHGYHAALRNSDPDVFSPILNTIDNELCGFAFEGAAMALAIQDVLMPWPGNRVKRFLEGPGAAHTYMVHVGVGWALARLPWRNRWPNPKLDPLLGWLAADGYGFHEGYFKWPRAIRKQLRPPDFCGYAGRAFDQGLGRSLWFVEGADATNIAHAISTFPAPRHADLWSGVGLACSYAGGADEETIHALSTAAGSLRPYMAQGAAFAAKARQRAGNPTTHTDLACMILCACDADTAAALTDQALLDLPANCGEPSYEVWRQRIRDRFIYRSSRQPVQSVSG